MIDVSSLLIEHWDTLSMIRRDIHYATLGEIIYHLQFLYWKTTRTIIIEYIGSVAMSDNLYYLKIMFIHKKDWRIFDYKLHECDWIRYAENFNMRLILTLKNCCIAFFGFFGIAIYYRMCVSKLKCIILYISINWLNSEMNFLEVYR